MMKPAEGDGDEEWDPQQPWKFRHEPEGRPGVLDVGEIEETVQDGTGFVELEAMDHQGLGQLVERQRQEGDAQEDQAFPPGRPTAATTGAQRTQSSPLAGSMSEGS